MLLRVAVPDTGKTRSHEHKRMPSFGEAFLHRYLAGAWPRKNPRAGTTQVITIASTTRSVYAAVENQREEQKHGPSREVG